MLKAIFAAGLLGSAAMLATASASAQEAIAYPLMSAAIRAGCRVAIELSKRI